MLYLIVKNHAFTDGNKRIAAACFLMFLERNNRLGPGENLVISNEALASLTLFVAVSKPENMIFDVLFMAAPSRKDIVTGQDHR